MEKAEESALLLKHSNSEMICRIVLTCVLLREDHTATTTTSTPNAPASGGQFGYQFVF